MNKLYIAAFSTLLLTSIALADHHTGGRRAGKHTDKLINKLQLTDEQRQPVADILSARISITN